MLQDCSQSGGAAYYFNGEMHYVAGTEEVVGQVLLNENFRSVNYLYRRDTETPAFQLARLRRRYTPVEVLKALGCYSYQACETPDWKATDAYTIVQMLKTRAISQLPGYDEAAWEVWE
jgi:hypothetical protein